MTAVSVVTDDPLAAAGGGRLRAPAVSDGGLEWNAGLRHALALLGRVPDGVLFLSADLPTVVAADVDAMIEACPAQRHRDRPRARRRAPTRSRCGRPARSCRRSARRAAPPCTPRWRGPRASTVGDGRPARAGARPRHARRRHRGARRRGVRRPRRGGPWSRRRAHAELRRDDPARPAVLAVRRAGAAGRAVRLRQRAGRTTRTCCGRTARSSSPPRLRRDRADPARLLRHEPRHARADGQRELPRDAERHVPGAHRARHRPRRLGAAHDRLRPGHGRRVRALDGADPRADERPAGDAERQGDRVRVGRRARPRSRSTWPATGRRCWPSRAARRTA